MVIIVEGNTVDPQNGYCIFFSDCVWELSAHHPSSIRYQESSCHVSPPCVSSATPWTAIAVSTFDEKSTPSGQRQKV